MTSQDLVKGIDITGLTSVTGSQINQTVDAGRLASDKGLNIVTTDTALGVPEVPNPAATIEGVLVSYWQRYSWIRRPHVTDTDGRVLEYQWNPNAVNDPVYLKWQAEGSDISQLETDVAAAQADATSALALAGLANTNATNSLNTATTAAEDVVILDGELTTLELSVEIVQQDITALQLSIASLEENEALPYNVSGIFNSLSVYNNVAIPNTKIDIVMSELTVSSSNGKSKIVTIPFDTLTLTADIGAAVGINGPDVAAINSVWYYVWVIYNPETNTFASLLSQSSTSPILPAGYTYKALVSSVYRNGSGIFTPYHQYGKQVWTRPTAVLSNAATFGDNTYGLLSGGTLTLFRTIIPPIAKSFSGTYGSTVVSSGGSIAFAADVNGLGENLLFGVYADAVFDGWRGAGSYSVPNINHNFAYKGYGVGAYITAEITGFII